MEICTIRSQLEGLAITRGLGALTEQNFATMQAALEEMRVADESGDVVALCRQDRRFHFELFAAAGMPRLTRLITLLWDQSDPYRAVFLSDPASRARGHDEHTAMVALARAGDADALVAMLDHHRTSPLDSIRHLL
jgi:DNA-binding GntR family transcriptional regulator